MHLPRHEAPDAYTYARTTQEGPIITDVDDMSCGDRRLNPHSFKDKTPPEQLSVDDVAKRSGTDTQEAMLYRPGPLRTKSIRKRSHAYLTCHDPRLGTSVVALQYIDAASQHSKFITWLCCVKVLGPLHLRMCVVSRYATVVDL